MGKTYDIEIRKVLKKKLLKKVNLRKVKKRSLIIVGNRMVALMKARILKGISPIRGRSRFPEYKAAGAVADFAKAFGIKGKKRKALEKGQGYPFSVQDRYPDKKPRPVNLKLSGEFLDSIKVKAKTGLAPRIIVYFDNKLSIQKEKGHRSGHNGQAKRPIFPIKGERLTVKLEAILRKGFQQILKKLINK